jgi:hypothetical protein
MHRISLFWIALSFIFSIFTAAAQEDSGPQVQLKNQYGCLPHRPKTTWQFVETRIARSAEAIPAWNAPPDSIAHGITVLTYNTHLIEGSSTEVGNWLKYDSLKFFKGTLYQRTDPIVFEDDRRAKLIVERIRKCQAKFQSGCLD